MSSSSNNAPISKQPRRPLGDHNQAEDDRENNEEGPIIKRQKSSSTKSAAEELICPITLQLPYDPVIALDGRTYERSAIEQHISRCNDERGLKSPITNEPIGQHLIPSLQTKNVIETLIENGSITGELAEVWKKSDKKHKKELERLREIEQQAKNGNADDMYKLASIYMTGHGTIHKDKKLALNWLKKAADEGHIVSMYTVGLIMLEEEEEDGGTDPIDTQEALLLMASAAENGSRKAAYYLGNCYRLGRYNLSVNEKLALYWLRKVIDPSTSDPKDTTDDIEDEARESIALLEA